MMKKILILFLFSLIVASANAQDNICIWGLQYGTSIKDVAKILEKEKNIKGHQSRSSQDALDFIIYNDCSFAGETAKSVMLYFHEEKLLSAIIEIVPKKAKVISVFSGLYDNLSKKYGSPTNLDYDTDVTSATLLRRVKNGSGKVQATWTDAAQNYMININVNDEFSVNLIYADMKKTKVLTDKSAESDIEDL